MSDKDKDILADILTRVESAVLVWMEKQGGFDQATKDAITAQIRAQEKPVRRDYARVDVYVAARGSDHAQAKAAALAEIKRTGKVAAATRYGVSRATLYRMLKR